MGLLLPFQPADIVKDPKYPGSLYDWIFKRLAKPLCRPWPSASLEARQAAQRSIMMIYIMYCQWAGCWGPVDPHVLVKFASQRKEYIDFNLPIEIDSYTAYTGLDTLTKNKYMELFGTDAYIISQRGLQMIQEHLPWS